MLFAERGPLRSEWEGLSAPTRWSWRLRLIVSSRRDWFRELIRRGGSPHGSSGRQFNAIDKKGVEKGV